MRLRRKFADARNDLRADGLFSAAVDGVLGSGDARITGMLFSLLPERARQPPAWIAEPHPP